jgi:hypothetical protein
MASGSTSITSNVVVVISVAPLPPLPKVLRVLRQNVIIVAFASVLVNIVGNRSVIHLIIVLPVVGTISTAVPIILPGLRRIITLHLSTQVQVPNQHQDDGQDDTTTQHEQAREGTTETTSAAKTAADLAAFVEIDQRTCSGSIGRAKAVLSRIRSVMMLSLLPFATGARSPWLLRCRSCSMTVTTDRRQPVMMMIMLRSNTTPWIIPLFQIKLIRSVTRHSPRFLLSTKEKDLSTLSIADAFGPRRNQKNIGEAGRRAHTPAEKALFESRRLEGDDFDKISASRRR